MILQTNSTNKIQKLYSIFLSILPILAIYSVGIPGLNLADIILVIFTLYVYVQRSINREVSSVYNPNSLFYLISFAVYIWTIPFIASLFASNTVEIVIRTVRISFYIFCICNLSKPLLDKSVLYKWIVRICLACVVFVIFQYMSYYLLGKVIHGYLNFIPLYETSYAEMDYSYIYYSFFRPTGFFLEPAHCSRYLVIGVVISLFDKKDDNSLVHFLNAIFISFGIILTTSGQGLMLVMVVWLIFLISMIKQRVLDRKQFAIFFSLLCAIPFVIYKMSESQTVLNTLSRILTNGSVLESGAVQARIGTISNVFQRNVFSILFGSGYGSVPFLNAWQSGVTYILYGSGIIGLIIIVLLFVSCYRNVNICLKVITIVYLLLLLTDDSFNSYMLVFYMSLMVFEGIEEKMYEECAVNSD